MDFKINRRGQITIFIILALMILVALAIIFLLINPVKIDVYDENNPQASIESCVRESVEEALSILTPQGGDIVPKGSMRYEGEDITYLCYNPDFYKRCLSQRPLLVEHIEKEITDYITPRVNLCFNKLEDNLRSRYDDVEVGEMTLTTRLYPKQVVIEINKKISASRGDQSRTFERFRMNMVHPIYDLAKLSTEIANQEAKYCNFDDLGYMILYPQYDITSIITGDSDMIYVVKERATNQQFRFETKSCLLPAGF